MAVKNSVAPKAAAKHELLFNKPASEASLLNKRLMLGSSIRCEQIYQYELYDFGHTLLCYLLKSDLDVQQTPLRCRFVEQKLALSSNIRCDQIHNNHFLEFGHTFLCYLSRT